MMNVWLLVSQRTLRMIYGLSGRCQTQVVYLWLNQMPTSSFYAGLATEIFRYQKTIAADNLGEILACLTCLHPLGQLPCQWLVTLVLDSIKLASKFIPLFSSSSLAMLSYIGQPLLFGEMPHTNVILSRGETIALNDVV